MLRSMRFDHKDTKGAEKSIAVRGEGCYRLSVFVTRGQPAIKTNSLYQSSCMTNRRLPPPSTRFAGPLADPDKLKVKHNGGSSLFGRSK
jgi:hypothetical protein